MILLDAGSLEPSAHLQLRELARRVAAASGREITPASWNFSGSIPADQLEGRPPTLLRPLIREGIASGQRHFTILPLLLSLRGVIAALIQKDLRTWAAEDGFTWSFTQPIIKDALSADHPLVDILVDDIERLLLAHPNLVGNATVALTDHGSRAKTSADLRNLAARLLTERLGPRVRRVVACSMETPANDPPHNRPLLEEVAADGSEPLVVSRFFLLPGRHAGSTGDLVRIVASAAPGRPVHHLPPLGAHPRLAILIAERIRESRA